MPRTRFVLALDQGTTSTRAILFGEGGEVGASAGRELRQSYPRPGWVEHDPEEIWISTEEVCRAVLEKQGIGAGDLAAIGITNQRETVVVWERDTGRVVHPAIVWQDRRSAAHCRELAAAGLEERVRMLTGLILDPYFSATKLAWLLQNVKGLRAAAEAGKLAFGTIDCFLLWRLTGGRVHASDVSNASRTLLFDIHRLEWSAEMLEVFGIPEALLPEVRENAVDFDATLPGRLGAAVPIGGMAGDQQAASLGQACLNEGDTKSTYGTGCFVLQNTGARALLSRNRLLTTVAWKLGGNCAYALEGSIFSAGATVQWLRDGLGILKEASESEALARAADPGLAVYLVPAFTGLGAPWWDAEARGAILGLTRDCGRAEIARAALEAMAFQTLELLHAMEADGAPPPPRLKVDGGM
ncbi:MAG: FGGY family carbohydrate kinase, partial [Planctomycetota bacterium]